MKVPWKKIKIPWKSLKNFKWLTFKSVKDFSRFNLDEPRIFKARTRLGFQGISFSSQGLNIKTYQGFFKVQPWKPRIFQGKDKVRISRNLATLILNKSCKKTFWLHFFQWNHQKFWPFMDPLAQQVSSPSLQNKST